MLQDPRFYVALARTFHEYKAELKADMEAADGLRKAPSKKNSELLNSLLGLPKNILKSG